MHAIQAEEPFFSFLLVSVNFSPVLAAEPAEVVPSTPASALDRAPLSKGDRL